jgi:pimeloyl-ACP methyl ester carboxylesterase
MIMLTAAGLLAASCAPDPSTAPTTTAAATTTVAPTTNPPSTTAAPATSATPDSEPDTTNSAPPTTQDPTFEAFQWKTVGDGPAEEGFLEVPLDYADPTGEMISLYVVRSRAADPRKRIGALLVNPGGPGYGGTVLALNAEAIYGQSLLDSFDIIGWDPRGTGESEPFIDCVDDYDPYVGVETGPDSPEQEAALEAAAAEFTAGCVERSGELLDHISTVDAARDMDAIRQALGEDTISYFGWSYGTQLGATWATLFPETVRAAVLDGSVNPTTGRVQGLIDQTRGFDSTLATFLADCSADATCPFNNGGDAEAAFAALLASLEVTPVPTAAGRPNLVDGVFEVGVALALYAESLGPQLAVALAAAQAGDGTGILSLYDQYYGRGTAGRYGNELEAYFAITCADDPPADAGPAAIAEAVAERANFVAVSRVPYTQAYELLVCASFPQFPTEPFEITGNGAPPIMVVGNTGDPATPYEGSKVMAETLEKGFFVTVEANTHTAYGLNDCINSTIEEYLVDLTIPATDPVCS